jgi:hypothetical protein
MEIQKTGSRLSGVADYRWEPLYDTLVFPAGAMTSNPMRFFSVPIGGAKSKVHTNMTQSGILPVPQEHKVYGMHVEAYVKADADANALAELCNLAVARFFIGTKDYFEGPLAALTGRIYMVQGGAGAAFLASFGAPASVAYRYPKDGFVQINAQESFGLEVINYSTMTLANPLSVRVYLDGMRKVDVR